MPYTQLLMSFEPIVKDGNDTKKISIIKIGDAFGRWTVIGNCVKKGRSTYYECLCKCGTKRLVDSNGLRNGSSKSCGCLRRELLRAKMTTHGKGSAKKETRCPEYTCWNNMRSRCYDTSNKKYKNYGGRGIKVYKGWINSFKSFFDYVGERPSPKHSLDRFPNVDGNYEPGNVRWATPKQQGGNKTDNRKVTYNGRTELIGEWLKILEIPNTSFYRNLRKRSMSEIEIFELYKNHRTEIRNAYKTKKK